MYLSPLICPENNDTIYGDSDDPNYTGAGGNDTINGGSGDDYCYGDPAGYVGYGGASDSITGGLGSDTLYGLSGDDIFFDNNDGAVDYIYGGDGTDTALAAQRDHQGVGGVNDVLSSIETP